MTTKTKTASAFELARADLARSGIAVKGPKDLERMGLRALSRGEALGMMPPHWTRRAPEGLCCLLFEYRDLRGRPTDFWRLRRLEDARATAWGTAPELNRYHQPEDSRPYLWLSTGVDWPAALASAAEGRTRVLFVEGEKKGLAICQRGGDSVVAIALGGVWNTGSRKQRIEVIPDLLEAADMARGFKPVVCFDTDPKLNTRLHVEHAAMKLGEILRAQGSEPLKATLPAGGDGKTGADDYIVEAGWDAFLNVIETAEPLFAKAEMTDLGNATRLARRAAGEFLFVPQWNRWLVWDGRRWAADGRGSILELAAEVTKDMLVEAGNTTAAARDADADDGAERMVKSGAKLASHALASQKSDRISAMVKLAPTAAPAALKADPEAFDADPWLFNVENGTVDLRTGELRPHDRGDLITRLAPVTYDPRARAPRFERFVAEVLPSRGVREFVQRFLGYVLTGDVREHKLAFFHGEGRNGKGVLMNTVSKLMGEYATVVPDALLVAQKFEGHPTEFMTLKGRRLALVSEVDKNRSWNEQRLKRLTGGDDITARGMREDFTKFSPTHKFVCLSNPRPRADADDHAVWERLKPVPFVVTYRDHDDTRPERVDWPVADRGLEDTLRGEWPGILNWLVEGCIAWQRKGLGEPEELREATLEYQSEQRELDPLTQYLRVNAVREGGMTLQEITGQFNKYVTVELRKPSSHALSTRAVAHKLRMLGYEVGRAGKGGGVRVSPRKVVELRGKKPEMFVKEAER